ncbi:MAG TPA: response regulator [Firmicutes bacterium]|nr:response regulator [Bacillota bacterium]
MDENNKMKVLVVDDELPLLEVMQDILKELGYDCIGANDGLEALEIVRETPDIDIVISDIKMPRLSGLNLVKTLSEERPDIIPIIMTGYIDSDILVSVLRAGAYDFLPKPYDARAITMILERSVEKRRVILENEHLLDELKKANKKLTRQQKMLEQKVLASDKTLHKKYQELRFINDVMKTINSSLDFNETIHYILKVVREVLSATTVSIMLLDDEKKHLTVIDGIGDTSGYIGERVRVGEGIAGWVAEHNEPLLVKDTSEEDLPVELKGERSKYLAASFISIPLVTIKKGVIGVLNVTNKEDGKSFTEEELEILKIFSEQAAIDIENTIIYEELESYYLQTVRALSKAIEAKDVYTRGHSERVTIFALELAREIGYNEEQLRNLELAGILHDIGKIGVPVHILTKPGKLTDIEYDQMKRHPVIGEEIIKDIKFLETCRAIIRNHHERMDGRGYPDGLSGDEIPEEVRIMTIADAFDAMTSDRPYRAALPLDEAVRRLNHDTGTQFDKNLVGIFVNNVVPKMH